MQTENPVYQGLEVNLFDFVSFDGDVVEMEYYDVTLNADIGKFKKGDVFERATLDFEKGELSLYDSSIVGKYRVGMVVLKDMLESD